MFQKMVFISETGKISTGSTQGLEGNEDSEAQRLPRFLGERKGKREGKEGWKDENYASRFTFHVLRI